MTPVEFLLAIENASFPLFIADPELIKAVAVLVAVECVEAEILPPLDLRKPFSPYNKATVFAITAAGRCCLQLEFPQLAESPNAKSRRGLGPGGLDAGWRQKRLTA